MNGEAEAPPIRPPAAIGAVVAWLVTSDETAAYSGTIIDTQSLCREKQLHPAWTWRKGSEAHAPARLDDLSRDPGPTVPDQQSNRRGDIVGLTETAEGYRGDHGLLEGRVLQ